MDDRDAITALLCRYADLIDAGDLDGVGELFTHGRIVTEDGAVLAEGAAAVATLYRSTTRLHDDGTPRTAHLLTNVVVAVDHGAGTAHARSRFTVLQATATVPLQPVITGAYRDRFTRRDDGWWFTERCMIPRLLGELGDHLLFDPGALGT